MTANQSGQWPQYTYVVPSVYTRAKMRLIGLGTYVPGGVITNDFFAYISTRLGSPRRGEDLERVTGLVTRHVRTSTLAHCRQMAGADAPGLIEDASAPAEESLTDMAVIASQRALASAGLDASLIDTVVGASSSDNDSFPTVAALVSQRLGLGPVRATMLKGACACQAEGFQICSEILATSSARLVLFVTSEAVLSNITNILDWKTSSLFGEGAAAFLFERGDDDAYTINGADARFGPALVYQTPLRKDVLSMAEIDARVLQLYNEGRGEELAQLLATYMVGYTHMNGKVVYREAPRALAECMDILCRHAELRPNEIAHIIPHQANSRITHRLGDLLVNDFGWPESTLEKLVDNFRFYGNISNASIALAMVELLRQGSLQEGQWLALPAVGGGLNYGCMLFRYSGLRYPEAIL